MAAAQSGSAWAETATTRAAALERASDLLEARGLIALLQAEGGKTLDDAVGRCARRSISAATRSRRAAARPAAAARAHRRKQRARLPRPRRLRLHQPVEIFSIFLGQVAAALVAGNSVVAKPAEQTPLVAAETVRILHAAGIPPGALHLLPGDGKVGAALVADARVAGVAFTGSTEVARAINRALAGKDARSCR